MGHFPFGESWYNATSEKLLFTSYERDSESGNDYAMARYYVNRLARFSSPDALAGSIANPQSLNRYSYVLNSPTSLVDPSGMGPCDVIMIDAKRRKLKRHILFAGMGPSELGELDPEPQDLGSDCIDDGGGGGGGGISNDPPTTDGSVCDVGMICVTSEAPFPDEPPLDPNAPPDFGNPDFGPNPFPLPTSRPTDPCAGFNAPLRNARVTTPFGSHDAMHTAPEGHHGDDYAGSAGTPVEAAFGGTVSFAGPRGGLGNLVIITNQRGSQLFAHLSSFANGANRTAYTVPGEPVTAGDVIGYVGNTGRVSGVNGGNHLHYEQHGPGPVFARGQTNPVNLETPCR